MVFDIFNTTPDIFLNQTHFVRLGIFHLELGKKHTFWLWEWDRISAPDFGDREPCKQNSIFKISLTLLHSEGPKLHRVLAHLSAIGLNEPNKPKGSDIICTLMMYVEMFYSPIRSNSSCSGGSKKFSATFASLIKMVAKDA